jgi:hypothetical protein
MRRNWLLMLAIAAGLAGACEKAGPLAPASPSAATTAVDAAVAANAGAKCAIDIGSTTRPLPALHFMAAMFGVASEQAGLNCGEIRALDAKLEAIAKALDQTPPNFEAGCGTSGALLNQLEAMLQRGALQNITFPPPAPEAPTTLLGLAEEVNGSWCAAARGELVGPGLVP